MVRVVPVNLAYNPRALWFDPGDLDIAAQDPVVVKTARGVEFGRAANGIIEVEESAVKALKSPLRKVVRLASEEDVEQAAAMEERGREALAYFREVASEHNPDMHPVAVEFLLDGNKAIFYFEAEERIDFRRIVRELVSHFHVRVDMRQIGVRDEARMVGGIGHCGQELCCKRMGGEFCPVSIRMAKDQDLSLNPQKISGLCGRLMCCLRYEHEAYKDFKQRAPKAGGKVSTPEGESKVLELDALRETVKLAREGEKPLTVPLSAFEEPEEGKRPSVVSQEGWDEALEAVAGPLAGEPVAFMTTRFTGTDQLAQAGAIHHNETSRTRAKQEGSKKREGSRRKSRSERQRGAKESRGAKAASGQPPKGRRRRSTTIDAQGRAQGSKAAEGSKGQGSQRQQGGSKKGGQRPGQRSSGIRAPKGSSGAEQKGGERSGQRRRRRSHKASGSGGGASSGDATGGQA